MHQLEYHFEPNWTDPIMTTRNATQKVPVAKLTLVCLRAFAMGKKAHALFQIIVTLDLSLDQLAQFRF